MCAVYASGRSGSRARVTIRTLQARKRDGPPVSMLTCYDYSSAQLMEEAGVDSLLVGDTYGEVCLGHSSTLPVTLDHLVTIAAGVRRGAPSVFLVGDMPYLSYQVWAEDAIRSGGKFMAQAGCDCVKVEVDRRLRPIVEAMVTAKGSSLRISWAVSDPLMPPGSVMSMRRQLTGRFSLMRRL